jgi:hypothetical protein|tara:strand:- start:36 stop:758 length:723 start_codon:yes stop_codon:yes gene_type:complete
MASTLTASTMTVTISESITLNGKNQGGTQTLSIPSIATVSRRIVDVPTSEVTIASMSTAVAAGTFVESDVRYIRITNLDDTNFVYLVFKNEYSNEFCLKLDKGKSFIYNGDDASGVIDTMLANQVALGFAETTGDCAAGSDDVTGITANGAIIPGLRISSAAIAAGATVGAVTGANGGVSAATAHTMVTRHATTGAETVSNATGNEDNDQTYAAGFGDLVEITAEADTASIDLEIFVASV